MSSDRELCARPGCGEYPEDHNISGPTEFRDLDEHDNPFYRSCRGYRTKAQMEVMERAKRYLAVSPTLEDFPDLSVLLTTMVREFE